MIGMKERTEQEAWYRSSFEALEKGLNGEAASTLHALRKNGLRAFSVQGFPTTKDEEWRFTNVRKIAETPFNPVLGDARSAIRRRDIDAFMFGMENVLVFVDGRYSAELSQTKSLPAGMIAESLAAATTSRTELVHRYLGRLAPIDNNPFIALNMAFVQDGAFVHVPRGVATGETIHLLFVSTGTEKNLLTLRNLFLVGEQAQLSIVESYVSLGDGEYLTNVVTELFLDPGAVVEHDKLQTESHSAYHVASIHAYQNRETRFTSNSVALGGGIVRNNVTTMLDAEGSDCTLNGLSLATGTQLIDNHTTIDHAKPHCTSHELYKAILDGKAHGVFNGKIFVRQDAQKTDAKQTNKTLLLSENAVIDTKPQLEIFADDVKCTHGATVGQLDTDQVFYLRTRGIDEIMAQDILTFAFAEDVVSRIHVEPLKEKLESLVHEKLGKGRKS